MSNFDRCFNLDSLTLNVTTDCNLKCIYCYEKHTKEYIQPDKIIELVDRIVDHYQNNNTNPHKLKKLSIAFFGGEPLLAFSSIKAMLDHIEKSKYDVSLSLTTNLTILTDEMISEIDKHQIYLLVSIDGTKEVHDKNRNGTFDIVSKNIKRLIDAGLKHLVEARITVLPEDFNNLVSGIKTIFELGIDDIAPVPVTDKSWTKEHEKILEIEIDKLFEWVLSVYEDENNKRNLSVKIIDDYLFHCITDKFDLKLTPCTVGSDTWISIAPNGNIYPCHQSCTRPSQKDELVIGNIFTDEINESKIIGKVKPHQWFKDKDPEYSCNSCEVFNMCSGGCPVENLEVMGSFYIPTNEWCKFVRVCSKIAKKYHNIILQTKNIRNRRINSLKANIELLNTVNETFKVDINDPSYLISMLNLYEEISGKDAIIMDGFREYFLTKCFEIKDQIESLIKEKKHV